MARLSRSETETVIRRSADQHCWDIYSSIPKDISRIKKMVLAFGGQLDESNEGDVRAAVPLCALTFRLHPRNPVFSPFLDQQRSISENKTDNA
jgi:hypothetical protein